MTSSTARDAGLPGAISSPADQGHELAAILALVHHSPIHLLTPASPGGSEKTRLPIAAASYGAPECLKGVAGVDPALVEETIARAPGLRTMGMGQIGEWLVLKPKTVARAWLSPSAGLGFPLAPGSSALP